MLDPGERERITVDIVRGCTITGTVIPQQARRLVTGARLVRADGAMRVPFHGTVAGFPMGEDGAFRWTGVPPGEWHVEVSRMVDSWPNAESQERPYRIRTWVRVATIDVPPVPELERDTDLRCVLAGRVRGFLVGTRSRLGRATLRPIGQRSPARWVGPPVNIVPDGSFTADLAPGAYRWMLYPGDAGPPRVGLLLEQSVEVDAGQETVAALAMPATEEVEVVFADELLQSLSGKVSLRYQSAPELRAGEYTVPPERPLQVEVVPGEPFFLDVPPHGRFRPEPATDNVAAGVARYVVKGR